MRYEGKTNEGINGRQEEEEEERGKRPLVSAAAYAPPPPSRSRSDPRSLRRHSLSRVGVLHPPLDDVADEAANQGHRDVPLESWFLDDYPVLVSRSSFHNSTTTPTADRPRPAVHSQNHTRDPGTVLHSPLPGKETRSHSIILCVGNWSSLQKSTNQCEYIVLLCSLFSFSFFSVKTLN